MSTCAELSALAARARRTCSRSRSTSFSNSRMMATGLCTARSSSGKVSLMAIIMYCRLCASVGLSYTSAKYVGSSTRFQNMKSQLQAALIL